MYKQVLKGEDGATSGFELILGLTTFVWLTLFCLDVHIVYW